MNKQTSLDIGASGIRLIVSDLDGTLLNASSVFARRTLQAVRAVREKGIAFTVCTGREYAMLGWFLRELDLDVPVICNNGAEVIHPVTGQVYMRQLLPKEESRRLLHHCMAEGIDFCLTTPTAAYFPVGSGLTGFYEDYEAMAAREGIAGFPVRYLSSALEMEALEHNKIIFRTDLPGYRQARDFVERHCPEMEFTTSSKLIADIIPRGVSKAGGLAAAARIMGIPPQACCAFGDFENDIPMFRFCGLSFAMGNAHEDVRRAATLVAPPNSSDGVAQMLEQYII
ncbi:MAG: HAD family phosphatase [Christensenellaceae bacterium]|nr:HAD family phosphatase [Christensenellaceae bacterium]